MNTSLQKSYEYCEHVAKSQARNFYYSFLTLPPDKKAAMCAIYAFMRYSDDVSDEAAADGKKADQMEEWRAALDRSVDVAGGTRGRVAKFPLIRG